MDLALEDHPIHKNQHGFQRRLSIETAISRMVNYTVGGYTHTVTVEIGFPQGGVCSAKFWIIAFNEAI